MEIEPLTKEIGGKLGLSQKTIETAGKLAILYVKKANTKNVSTEEIVAAAIYIAGILYYVFMQKRTQIAIGMSSGVSPAKISVVYRDMIKEIGEEEISKC